MTRHDLAQLAMSCICEGNDPDNCRIGVERDEFSTVLQLQIKQKSGEWLHYEIEIREPIVLPKEEEAA